MVRNIVILGGSSHPQLTTTICNHLGVPAAKVLLDKFSVGETRVEIQESVRGKDVFIIQSGGGKANDHLMELLVAISACKIASARRVTAVLPLFPYSRQPELPYNKSGAPLSKASNQYNKPDFPFTLETAPQTPHPDHAPVNGYLNGDALNKGFSKVQIDDSRFTASTPPFTMKHPHYQQYDHKDHNGNSCTTPTSTPHQTSHPSNGNGGGSGNGPRTRSDTVDSATSASAPTHAMQRVASTVSLAGGSAEWEKRNVFHPQPGYKQWVAQAGTLVADLLTCAGADHVITMDLHDAQYQGFFDIPVDNLYGRPLLKKYIQQNIPDFKNAVVCSPDAGGAKRATAIAESLGMPFALIHKERRPTRITDRQNATMMLVGNVANRTVILVDDLADTCNTITRAARLLKREGATRIYALITHGILSGGAIERLNNSDIDRVVVTNSLPQDEHRRRCAKLEVLEIGAVFAESIRRVHYGESISALFQYD